MAQFFARGIGEDRHAIAIADTQRLVRIDVELLERHAERAQQACHLLAQMAAGPPVEPSLYQ